MCPFFFTPLYLIFPLKMVSDRKLQIHLLGEFIKNKVGSNFINITLVDLKNFIVVKGKTSSNNLLNLSEIVDEFKKFYEISDEMKFFTIDLIEYNQDIIFNRLEIITVD